MQMKRTFLTLFVIICVANYIFSQTVSIDENFGDNQTDVWVKLLTFDKQGNIFALGYFPEVLKTNANGIRDQHFGTNGAVRLNDEYWSNWGETYGIKITNENKIVIIFSVIWHNSWGGGDDPPPKNQMQSFYPKSIKILSDSSIVLAGWGTSTSIFCKLNLNGNFVTDFADDGIFMQNIGNNDFGEEFTNIIEESNGNLLFTGRFIVRQENKSITRHYICSFNSNGTIN